MSYLLIQNAGAVELNAFMLMGASNKRGQSKIGMFGTGTKYAIATLLKAGIEPLVCSGLSEIRFTTLPTTLRGETHQQVAIVVDGDVERLGFTTEMGLGWGVKEALRELASNALDEEDWLVGKADRMLAIEGRTRIFIPMTNEVELFYLNLPKMFTQLRKPGGPGKLLGQFEHAQGACRVFECFEHGTRVYRRGVLVFENRELPSAFDYDIAWLALHEDRSCGLWEIQYELPKLLDMLPLPQKTSIIMLLAACCDQEVDCLESNLNSSVCSPSWKEAIERAADEPEARVVSSSVQSSGGFDSGPKVVLPERWATNLTNDSIACRGARDASPLEISRFFDLATQAAEALPDAVAAAIDRLESSEFDEFAGEFRKAVGWL